MKKISVDFDGTIARHFNGSSNPFENDVQNMVKLLINEGNDVHIITRRYSNPMLRENRIVYEVANNLGVNLENIHFTNRAWKWEKINEIGIDFHMDDDKTDIYYIDQKCPNTIGYHLSKEGANGFYELIKKEHKL